MSLEATNAAFKVRGLTAIERLVLLAYADHCNLDGECWPSQSTVSERIELCRQTVNKATKSLESKGMISITHRSTEKGSQTSNIVHLTDELLQNSGVNECDRGCRGERQGVSPSATGGVALDDRGCRAGRHESPIESPIESEEGPKSPTAVAAEDLGVSIVSSIPTIEEVRSQVGSVAYPLSLQCANAYYLDRDAGGWVTRHGHPIKSWRSDLQRFSGHWQKNGGDRDLTPEGKPKRERAF